MFPSLAELLVDIDSKGGRDIFVAHIAKIRAGYISQFSRYKKEGEKDGVVYALICSVDLKLYVGQTNSYNGRMRAHFSGHGGAAFLTNAIIANGRNKFGVVNLLAGIEQQEELDVAEFEAIKALDCMTSGNGYNIHPGGRGCPPSQETRQKMSLIKLGKPLSVGHKAAVSASKRGKRKPLTAEHRAKLSAALRGRTHTEKSKAAKRGSL